MSVVFMRNKTSEYRPLYECHLKYRSCLNCEPKLNTYSKLNKCTYYIPLMFLFTFNILACIYFELFPFVGISPIIISH